MLKKSLLSKECRETSLAGVHHVVLRGFNYERVFNDEQDRRKFLEILRQITHPECKNGTPLPPYCTIYAYCLMSNHIHILLAEGTEQMSDTVERISEAYINYYNNRYERQDPLFTERLHSRIVDNVGYFLIALRYIHQNPVKAGMVERPSLFQWSSFREYDGSIDTDCICSHTLPFASMSKKDVCELVVSVSKKRKHKKRTQRTRSKLL